jgi:hypothetical protein
MSKVIFCTVQNYTSNLWLDAKLFQLTYTSQQWWSDHQYPIVIVDRLEELNQYLDQADWLVVQTAGDIILERNHLWNKLHSIPDDVGFIGHIAWYDDVAPRVHPQCFILRTAAVKSLIFDDDCGISFIKSTDDLHQGHSPAEVFLNPGSEVSYGVGTNILQQVLLGGYRAVNFDRDWRYGTPEDIRIIPHVDSVQDILDTVNIPRLPSRGFCFPDINPNIFADALRKLETNTDLDTSQQVFVELFKNILSFINNDVVSILNWDSPPSVTSADAVVCTAGGFLAETIALRTGAKKIVFYDVNHHTVEFKRSLYTNWDGVDYFGYATAWARDNNLITEPRTLISQKISNSQQLDEILDNWAYFKTIDVEFIHGDIVKDPTIISNCVIMNTVVHTSNILGYYLPTAIAYTTDEIQEARDVIEKAIGNTNSYWSEI